METPPQSSPSMGSAGSADVLLVEDNANDAELTIRALRQCGISLRVQHVEDGAEALEYIASTNLFVDKQAVSVPKLILLDIKLDKMGGLQVLRRLKSDNRTKGIPIVVLTGSKLAIEVAESYQLGVNSYIIKPTDSEKFAETVGAIGRYWLAINEPPQPPFRSSSSGRDRRA